MSSNIELSQNDLSQAEALVRRALADVMKGWPDQDLATQGDDNLFDQIDSFAVVDLLLRTESEVEAVTGRYIPLADEKLLDAHQSPLRRIDDWVAHVATAIAHG